MEDVLDHPLFWSLEARPSIVPFLRFTSPLAKLPA